MTFAVVGATGAVGRELLSLLAERGIPAGSLRALASERSAGTEVAYGNGRMVVEELAEQSRAVLAGTPRCRRFSPNLARSTMTDLSPVVFVRQRFFLCTADNERLVT